MDKQQQKDQRRDTARHSRERHSSIFRINDKSPLLNAEKSYRWLPYQTHTHFGNKFYNDCPFVPKQSKVSKKRKCILLSFIIRNIKHTPSPTGQQQSFTHIYCPGLAFAWLVHEHDSNHRIKHKFM